MGEYWAVEPVWSVDSGEASHPRDRGRLLLLPRSRRRRRGISGWFSRQPIWRRLRVPSR